MTQTSRTHIKPGSRPAEAPTSSGLEGCSLFERALEPKTDAASTTARSCPVTTILALRLKKELECAGLDYKTRFLTAADQPVDHLDLHEPRSATIGQTLQAMRKAVAMFIASPKPAPDSTTNAQPLDDTPQIDRIGRILDLLNTTNFGLKAALHGGLADGLKSAQLSSTTARFDSVAALPLLTACLIDIFEHSRTTHLASTYYAQAFPQATYHREFKQHEIALKQLCGLVPQLNVGSQVSESLNNIGSVLVLLQYAQLTINGTHGKINLQSNERILMNAIQSSILLARLFSEDREIGSMLRAKCEHIVHAAAIVLTFADIHARMKRSGTAAPISKIE